MPDPLVMPDHDAAFEFYGNDAPDVRRLLIDRRRARYKAGSSSDGRKIALVFEGGAMRGLISCAAGARLQQLGFGGCFDSVYGTSAGAISAAYFTSDQADVALQIYLTDILRKEFMYPFRWPDQVDVCWLANNVVLAGPRKLDLEKIKNTPVHLQIPATQIETGNCRFFSNRHDPVDFIVPALAASGSPPMLVSHRTKIDGYHYNDGMMRSPVSSVKAFADGATDVVTLLCNPVGRRKKKRPLRSLLEQAVRIRHYPKAYQAVFHARADFYNQAMDAIHTPPAGGKTMALCPSKGEPVPRMLEKDTRVLNEVIKHQFDRIDAIFGDDAQRSVFRQQNKGDIYYD